MNAKSAKQVFLHLKNLWPKWGPNIAEQEEWGRILEKMEEQTARTAVSEFYQDYGRYDRPPVPDFLTVARRIGQFKLSQKKGVTVRVVREDGYCKTLTVYGTQDPERINAEACRFRDYLVAMSDLEINKTWRVVKPELAGVSQ